MPAGRVPSRWKIYRGTQVPIVVAYPPTWSVDQMNVPVGEISFTSRDGSLSGTIARRSTPGRSMPLAVLSAQFLRIATQTCEMGRTMQGTSEIHVSGTRFATAIARCAGEQERAGRHEHAATFYIGVGRKSGAEWTFSFRGDRGGFVANRRTYFLPILRTLNIYGR